MNTRAEEAIRNLRATAIQRCRERIDEAAKKARGAGVITRDPEYGVSSILKRRHGL
jgi:hypothetical protein